MHISLVFVLTNSVCLAFSVIIALNNLNADGVSYRYSNLISLECANELDKYIPVSALHI